MIQAIIIDSREPSWIQDLKFGDIPKVVTLLDYGDLWAVCDDGATLIVERKQPDDFLNTLRDDRLFPQLARMVEPRLDSQATGKITHWPYLVITGNLSCGPDGKVITDGRTTGWDYRSVWGALLTAQEMGVFVVFTASELDYESAVLRLGQRMRDSAFKILPARPPQTLGVEGGILTSLPGIGIEKVIPILDACTGVGWALEALTDDESQIPGIGAITKRRIRQALGLEEKGLQLSVTTRKDGKNAT